MKIKRVLFVTSVYKPNVGGIETCVANLSNFYKRYGVQAAVLTKKYPFDLPEFEIVEGLPTLRVSRPMSAKDFQNIFEIINKYREKIEPDIIHLIGVRRPMPTIGLFLSKLWKVPFVVSFAGGDLPNLNDPETLKLWEEGRDTVPDAVFQADHHIAFSKDLINLARETIPSLGKIDLIFAGIDTKQVTKTKKIELPYPYIFSARRLTHDKGIDILIKAFCKIASEYKRINLLIAGDGEERGKLEQLVEEAGMNKRVRFLGEIEPDRVFGYMKGALAHVCPSRAEGGGVVNLEAQAAGCLSIGSNTGGIPEYIEDNKTGILFENENIDDLYEKLRMIINDRKLTNRIITGAKRNIKRFDWNFISKQHLDVYEKVLEKNLTRQIIPWNKLSTELLVNLFSNESSKTATEIL